MDAMTRLARMGMHPFTTCRPPTPTERRKEYVRRDTELHGANSLDRLLARMSRGARLQDQLADTGRITRD